MRLIAVFLIKNNTLFVAVFLQEAWPNMATINSNGGGKNQRNRVKNALDKAVVVIATATSNNCHGGNEPKSADLVLICCCYIFDDQWIGLANTTAS